MADAENPATTVTLPNPCPEYATADVIDNPTGDWDRDGTSNLEEFFELAPRLALALWTERKQDPSVAVDVRKYARSPVDVAFCLRNTNFK